MAVLASPLPWTLGFGNGCLLAALEALEASRGKGRAAMHVDRQAAKRRESTAVGERSRVAASVTHGRSDS